MLKSDPELGRVWTAALGGLQIAVQAKKSELQQLPIEADNFALQPLVVLRWDDAVTLTDEDRRRLWQQLWHAANILLPATNTWMAADRDCALSALAGAPAYQPKMQGSAEWIEACALVHASLSGVLARLASRELDAPVVGYELTDEAGCVVAEAELAWKAKRLVVLMSAALSGPFEVAGWTVVLATDGAVEQALEAVLRSSGARES
jgi:DEAD/DEAH box helicase domain-containing protein